MSFPIFKSRPLVFPRFLWGEGFWPSGVVVVAVVGLQEGWGQGCSKAAFISQAYCYYMLQINKNSKYLKVFSYLVQWSMSKMCYFNGGRAGLGEIDGDNEGVDSQNIHCN